MNYCIFLCLAHAPFLNAAANDKTARTHRRDVTQLTTDQFLGCKPTFTHKSASQYDILHSLIPWQAFFFSDSFRLHDVQLISTTWKANYGRRRRLQILTRRQCFAAGANTPPKSRVSWNRKPGVVDCTAVQIGILDHRRLVKSFRRRQTVHSSTPEHDTRSRQ